MFELIILRILEEQLLWRWRFLTPQYLDREDQIQRSRQFSRPFGRMSVRVSSVVLSFVDFLLYFMLKVIALFIDTRVLTQLNKHTDPRIAMETSSIRVANDCIFPYAEFVLNIIEE